MFGIRIERHDTGYYVASTSRFKSVRLVVLPPDQIRPYAPNPFPRWGVK